MAKINVLHEASAYINRYTYRAIEVNGVVKIQSKRAWDRRWFTNRTMSLKEWQSWEADANLAYNSCAIYELLDHRTEQKIAEEAWENRGR